MGSFGEGASFFGEFGLARPSGALNGEMGAERGDVFWGFRPGGCARRRDLFLFARSCRWGRRKEGGELRVGGALRWRGAAKAWRKFGGGSWGFALALTW